MKIDHFKYDTNPFYGNGSGCNRVVTVGNDVWIGQGGGLKLKYSLLLLLLAQLLIFH